MPASRAREHDTGGQIVNRPAATVAAGTSSRSLGFRRICSCGTDTTGPAFEKGDFALKWADSEKISATARMAIRKGNQPGSSPEVFPDLDKGDSRDKIGERCQLFYFALMILMPVTSRRPKFS